jgi:hypothetical protein
MPALVLDSDALSRLLLLHGDSATERLRAALHSALERHWLVRVPSLVLAELCRDPA